MKNIFILLAVVLFWGCASSDISLEPAPEPIISGQGTYCAHKYDSNSTFVYVGQLKAYQKKMFGVKVFVYEFTLQDGKKLFLSQHDLPNYICKKL